MFRTFLAVFGFALALASPALALDQKLLEAYQDFWASDRFAADQRWGGYQHPDAHVCGLNVEAFVQFAAKRGVDVSQFKVVRFEFKEWTPYLEGMWAYHVRPSPRTPGPARLLTPKPETTMWWHHYVLEVEGQILDFFYDVKPRTPTVAEYFSTQVYPVELLPDYMKKKAGIVREIQEKMVVKTFPAGEIAVNDPPSAVSRPLGAYLREVKLEQCQKPLDAPSL